MYKFDFNNNISVLLNFGIFKIMQMQNRLKFIF